MQCSNCSKKINNQASFCPYCGQKIKKDVESLDDRSKHIDKVQIVFFILVIIFIAVLFKSKKETKVDTISESKKIFKVISKFDCNGTEYFVQKDYSLPDFKILVLSKKKRIIAVSKVEFNNLTKFSNFVPICNDNRITYLRFNAYDKKWNVKYLWDIRKNIFYYIAKNKETNMTKYSKNLTPGSKIEFWIKSIEVGNE